jgi:glycosyltransferase involved in cell wall biosynthesis
LARALPPLDPAVVMSNTLASPVGALAARHAGRPHLWFAHELVSGAHTLAFDLPRSSALAMVGRLSSAVAVNSSWLAAQLGPSVGIPTRVVPLVVPVVDRPAHHHGAAKLRLVMVARLVAGKGHALVMDAVGLARRDGLDVELTLVGDGPVAMTRALVAHLRRLGLSDVVHFAGHQRDVTAFLDDADVAVVASTDEALGRATIEAMKRGVAVVGLGAGGTTELLADGRGWCVGPGQGADRRLAAALREARDPASRRVRAARAQAYALGCFSEEAAATGLLAALELAWVRAACATG